MFGGNELPNSPKNKFYRQIINSVTFDCSFHHKKKIYIWKIYYIFGQKKNVPTLVNRQKIST